MIQARLFEAPQIDEAPRIIVDHDGVVTYDPYFIDPWAADQLFAVLRSETPWVQEHLKMYGRRIPFPRLTAWYGDPGAMYEYSGVRNEPLPWTSALRDFRDKLRVAVGVKFNSVLLNLYRTGKDSLSWHADDEPELGREPVIASVSLGVTRRFMLKHATTGQIVEVPLQHGSLLLMTGSTQANWKHQVPKEGKITEQRINLTFRVIDARRDEAGSVRTDRGAGSRQKRRSS